MRDNPVVTDLPFNLDSHAGYRQWRQNKFEGYQRLGGNISVPVNDINKISDAEYALLLHRIRVSNMVVYFTDEKHSTIPALIQFCRRFGLNLYDHNLYSQDGVSTITVSEEKRQFEYIPYSDKAINWHTDGYYNLPDKVIRAMVLHCVQPAAQGGTNRFLDHDMVYIGVRDHNPRYVEALMRNDAMTIPANIENGIEIRPRQSGPVFSVDVRGNLHMRYTARTRSIEWRSDSLTRDAVACLEEVIAGASTYIFEYQLRGGQGVLTNNVLHTRSKFDDGDECKRKVLRIRSFDRIDECNINDGLNNV